MRKKEHFFLSLYYRRRCNMEQTHGVIVRKVTFPLYSLDYKNYVIASYVVD